MPIYKRIKILEYHYFFLHSKDLKVTFLHFWYRSLAPIKVTCPTAPRSLRIVAPDNEWIVDLGGQEPPQSGIKQFFTRLQKKNTFILEARPKQWMPWVGWAWGMLSPPVDSGKAKLNPSERSICPCACTLLRSRIFAFQKCPSPPLKKCLLVIHLIPYSQSGAATAHQTEYCKVMQFVLQSTYIAPQNHPTLSINANTTI